MLYKLSTALCASLALSLSSAHAASPIGNAGTAVANKGEFSYELRMGYQFDEDNPREDGRFRVRQHIDYGFSDWYAVRIVAEQDRRDGDELDFTGLTIENRFQIFEKDEHGWDGGVRAIYIFGTSPGDPDEVDVRLIANVPVGDNWSFRHNTILEHEIGDNAADGVLMELRTQMVRDFRPNDSFFSKVSVGVEMFSDLGELNNVGSFDDQNHQIGPVVKANFGKGAYLQFGYRAGLSDDAPDNILKLFLGRKF